MRARSAGIWIGIHKWTSLFTTLFLFLVCLTGLPLIFDNEIDRLLGARPSPEAVAPGTPMLSLDRILEIARAHKPGEALTFASPDDQDPVWRIAFAPTMTSDTTSVVTIDGHTGHILRSADSTRSATMRFIKDLHTELLLEDEGMLLLCFIGLCFIASIVSGVVVYGPFMRRVDFAAVRTRTKKIFWLDIHNLGGIVIVAWLLVVSITGVINTLSNQIANHWRSTELVQMIAPWRSAPVPAKPSSPQAAIDTALARFPGNRVSTIAMPGSLFAGGHHYGVYLNGNTPLTSRLLTPVLVNAENGTFSESRKMPLYVTVFFASKPLHFGDYGGMPLKIIWTILDIISLIVLWSGLRLWWPWQRRRAQVTAEPAIS